MNILSEHIQLKLYGLSNHTVVTFARRYLTQNLGSLFMDFLHFFG